MLNTILAKKDKMGAAYIGGTRVPVTYVTAGPCVVTQIKTQDSDGYHAIQLGFGEKNEKNLKNPQKGHLKNFIKDARAPRKLKEVRLIKDLEIKVGDVVNASDVLKVGDLVVVKGKTKGKGFQGGVKRWGFAGGSKTHGQSDRQRAPGSIGQGTTPGRVYKGKKMAGRMGNDTLSIKNLMVVSLDAKTGMVGISGSVAGTIGSFLEIKKIGRGKLSDLIVEEPAQVIVEEVVEEPKGEGETADKSTESESVTIEEGAKS